MSPRTDLKSRIARGLAAHAVRVAEPDHAESRSRPLHIRAVSSDRWASIYRRLGLAVGLLIATLAFAGDPPPRSVPESKSSAIGYKTVAEALASLKQMQGMSFSSVRGWTIVTDEAHLTVWSFAPKSDPSYPAVVKRTVISTGGGSRITMDVLCEADKTACDNLVREFSNGRRLESN